MIINVKEYRHKMSVILHFLHYRFAYCHLAHNFGVKGGFIRLNFDANISFVMVLFCFSLS